MHFIMKVTYVLSFVPNSRNSGIEHILLISQIVAEKTSSSYNEIDNTVEYICIKQLIENISRRRKGSTWVKCKEISEGWYAICRY